MRTGPYKVYLNVKEKSLQEVLNATYLEGETLLKVVSIPEDDGAGVFYTIITSTNERKIINFADGKATLLAS